ncbi:MAG: non-canonical purine NTP pyrophosphatase, RdgB/HAM1 family [Flavobacteriales bacterium]|nr:non-canonical purine NTP pyrophosphatase, RdgB/HAM1 family [Flavobacteriales bacterium]
MDLVFATNNKNKLKEIKHIIIDKINILSINDLNHSDDLEETGLTLKDNASQKARFIYKKFNKNCFADDSGLEILSLNNEPGVFSARYAGLNCSADDNMNKVLKKLESIKNRNAIFKTVICLILDGKEYFFEGSIEGIITNEKIGYYGFGYDPIFRPNNFNLTFAQMSVKEKSKISHRAIAVSKFVKFINQRFAS